LAHTHHTLSLSLSLFLSLFLSLSLAYLLSLLLSLALSISLSERRVDRAGKMRHSIFFAHTQHTPSLSTCFFLSLSYPLSILLPHSLSLSCVWIKQGERGISAVRGEGERRVHPKLKSETLNPKL